MSEENLYSHYASDDEFQVIDSAQAERNLMRAILRSAIEDLKKTGEPYRQARKYFLSADQSYLYSYLSICNHLNICPKTLRHRLGLYGEPLHQRLAA